MSEKKSCMNCQHHIGGERDECLLNTGMRVNKRMVCEEWRSDDLGGVTPASKSRNPEIPKH